VQVTRNRTGRFVERNNVGGGAEAPRVAASGGKAFVAWTTWNNPSRVYLSEETPDGVWTLDRVSPESASHHRLAALAATGGKATVLIMTPTHLYARSQP